MKTGDAEVTLWLEGCGGRSYELAVSSTRSGKYMSKQWSENVRYRWGVAQWVGGDHVKEGGLKVAHTFAEGMRLARRLAERLERVAAKRAKR